MEFAGNVCFTWLSYKKNNHFCFKEQVLIFHQGKKFVCSIMLIMFSTAEIRDLRLKLCTAHNPEQYYNLIENRRQFKLKIEESLQETEKIYVNTSATSNTKFMLTPWE